jgi:hypothetical protein
MASYSVPCRILREAQARLSLDGVAAAWLKSISLALASGIGFFTDNSSGIPSGTL